VGGACVTLVEDCQNGVDDDEDNLIDCADPACTAFACATTPLGWTGPVALWSGTSGNAPACPTAYPSDLLDAHDNLVVPPYTCPSCTCTPQNASCSDLTFWFDTTTGCSSSSAWLAIARVGGSCSPLFLGHGKPDGGTARSSQLKPGNYVTGTCVANQTTPQFTNPSWGTDVLACGGGTTSGGGCGAGQCVPKPVAPFNTKLCIFRPGINACPSSYPNEMPSTANPQYYAAFVDGRTCSQCTCGAPSCGGTITTYTDGTCGGANATVVDMTGGCTTLPADPTMATLPGGELEDTRSIRWTNAAPVCGNVTSSLQGGVTPDTPVSVCCQN
jgi:hypothetical protein